MKSTIEDMETGIFDSLLSFVEGPFVVVAVIVEFVVLLVLVEDSSRIVANAALTHVLRILRRNKNVI